MSQMRGVLDELSAHWGSENASENHCSSGGRLRTPLFHVDPQVQMEGDILSSFPQGVSRSSEKRQRSSPPRALVVCQAWWGWSREGILGARTSRSKRRWEVRQENACPRVGFLVGWCRDEQRAFMEVSGPGEGIVNGKLWDDPDHSCMPVHKTSAGPWRPL